MEATDIRLGIPPWQTFMRVEVALVCAVLQAVIDRSSFGANRSFLAVGRLVSAILRASDRWRVIPSQRKFREIPDSLAPLTTDERSARFASIDCDDRRFRLERRGWPLDGRWQRRKQEFVVQISIVLSVVQKGRSCSFAVHAFFSQWFAHLADQRHAERRAIRLAAMSRNTRCSIASPAYLHPLTRVVHYRARVTTSSSQKVRIQLNRRVHKLSRCHKASHVQHRLSRQRR